MTKSLFPPRMFCLITPTWRARRGRLRQMPKGKTERPMNWQTMLERVRVSGQVDERYWYTRYAKPVIFLIIILALAGLYLAFTIPVSVFPTTDFPRVLIGVDNGVMPIDQMMVTITRPIEEAVNSVPGLQQVRSITSRGEAEVDLFFEWHVDMVT